MTRVPAPPPLRRARRVRSQSRARAAVASAGLLALSLAAPVQPAPAVTGAAAPAAVVPGTAAPGVVVPGAVAPDALASGAVASAAGRPGAAGPGRAAGYLSVPADDQVRDEQWQLDYLDATDAWERADGNGVTVAVLDSGVDSGHPDLAGQVLPGIDLVDGSTDGRIDLVGHGTTVAALIAGRNDDGRGVVGLAPKAKILPVRVLNKDNRYDDATTVANGVRWAVDHGARVLNLSLGGNGTSEALAEALDYAFDKDVVVVACTGNITPPAATQVWYPAREPGVLAVAGLGHDDSDEPLWSSSITGPQTVLAAPAADLLGARPGGYWRVQGTSFAAPLVSATAALVRSRWPRMSAANVVNRIVSTARDLGAAGRDDEYGFGAVDPVGALTGSVSNVDHNPLDTNAPHGVAGFGPAPDPGAADAPSHVAPARAAQRDPAEGHSGAGAKRAAAAPASDRGGPWRGLLGGLAACITLVAVAATAASRVNRR